MEAQHPLGKGAVIPVVPGWGPKNPGEEARKLPQHPLGKGAVIPVVPGWGPEDPGKEARQLPQHPLGKGAVIPGAFIRYKKA